MASVCKGCCKRYREENKEKIRASQKRYREENREKVNNYKRKWVKNNSEKVNNYKRKWVKNNPDKVRNIHRKTGSKAVKTLSDNYVKKLFTNRSPLTAADIPPELIALKREEIKLKRLIKEKSNV